MENQAETENNDPKISSMHMGERRKYHNDDYNRQSRKEHQGLQSRKSICFSMWHIIRVGFQPVAVCVRYLMFVLIGWEPDAIYRPRFR